MADQNISRETGVSDKCVEQNSHENVECRENETLSRINMKGGRVVTCGGNEVDKPNAERRGSSVCCQSPREQEQPVPALGVQDCEADNPLHGGNEQPAVGENLQEILHQPNGVTLVKSNEEKRIASPAVQDSEVHSSNYNDLKIAHGSKQHAETKRDQDVSNQPHVLPCEPAKPPSSDAEGSSREKDNKSTSCHSSKIPKPEQQYPYPSVQQLRRKKVPWSIAEEEALKEGIRKFTSRRDYEKFALPWKKILESGAGIFEKHRTPIHLKDKWKNICKRSPNV